MSMDWGHLPWFWGLGMLVGMGALFLLWALIPAALILLVRWLWFQGGPDRPEGHHRWVALASPGEAVKDG
jgi:hypothetical protein